MGYNSYQVFVPSGPNGPLFNDSLESTTIAGTYNISGFHNKNRALFSIFNPKGSNKIIEISDIIMNNNSLASISNSNAITNFSLAVGTTAPDGTDISDQIISLDTNYTIPSDIYAYFGGSSDILSGFNIVQKIILNSNLNKAGIFVFNQRLKNNKFYGIGNSSDIQILTLNQNETFSIFASGIGNSYITSINVIFSIDNNICQINIEASVLENIPILSIRNENSTYSVKIINVFIDQYALDTYSNITIEKIEGISEREDNDTIESLEPIPFDTNYPWPSEIKCKKNTAVLISGTKDSATLFNYNLTTNKSSPIPFRAITPASWGIRQGVSGIMGGMNDSYNINSNGPFYPTRNRKSNLILKEGEGIAIFNRGVGGVGVSARIPLLISIKIDIFSKEKIYFGV